MWSGIVWSGVVWSGSVVRCSVVRYSVVRCSVVRYSVVRCSVVRCSVVRYVTTSRPALRPKATGREYDQPPVPSVGVMNERSHASTPQQVLMAGTGTTYIEYREIIWQYGQR
jgi:hypothetical protein